MSERTEAGGWFVPATDARLAVSPDGALVAVHEAGRVVLVDLADGAPLAEVGIDPAAGASELAWLASPPRLLVLARYAGHSVIHLLEPRGPRLLAELRLEAPVRLAAAVGGHALAVGPMGAALLSASDQHLLPHPFPARAAPSAAGTAGALFVVALAGTSGAVEEWDPATRMPRRRFRLPRPATIRALGGTERQLWFMTTADPTRLEVIPIVNRGQPRVHALPEPIGQVAGHPRAELVACLGADAGQLYVVDLDGRGGIRELALPGLDRPGAVALVHGARPGVLAAQAGRPLGFVPLDAPREVTVVEVTRPRPTAWLPPSGGAPAGSTLGGGPDDVEAAEAGRAGPLAAEPPAAPAAPPAAPAAPPAADPRGEVDLAPAPPRAVDGPPAARTPPPPPTAPLGAAPTPVSAAGAPSWAPARPPAPAAAAVTGQDLDQRFSAWRERMRQGQPRAGEVAAPFVAQRPAWRDDLAGWARSVLAGAEERGAPASDALDQAAARHELPAALAPALALLYGAHLVGQRGVAPADVARVLGRRWDEALGQGALAASGVARFAKSRVRLAGAARRALDGAPPRHGVLVGAAGPAAVLLGPCVVVAAEPRAPLRALAAEVLAVLGGALLVADQGAPAAELLAEARAQGAAPMWRATPGEQAPASPVVLVVADEAEAERLALPRLL